MNNNENTTKENCSLQNQKQVFQEPNKSMIEFFMERVWTDQDFDDKCAYLKRMMPFERFTQEQKDFIFKSIEIAKLDGYYRAFVYKGHECFVELDDLGRWRIYVEIKQGEKVPEFSEYDSFGECGYSHVTSLKGFHLALWNYSSWIGLDDFIGVNLFSTMYWIQFFRRDTDFSTMRRKEKKKPMRVIRIESMVKLCMHLCDCLVKYNDNSIEIQTNNNFDSVISSLSYIKNIASDYSKKKDFASLNEITSILRKTIEQVGEING